MQRVSLRTIHSILAALLLLVIGFASNFSAIEQGMSIICHQVLGMRDTLDHPRNHTGSNHQHRHPGQKEPHQHGDPAQVYVMNDFRLELKVQGADYVRASGLFLIVCTTVSFMSLMLSGFDAAKYFSSSIRPPGQVPVFLSRKRAPGYVLSSAPNAPPVMLWRS